MQQNYFENMTLQLFPLNLLWPLLWPESVHEQYFPPLPLKVHPLVADGAPNLLPTLNFGNWLHLSSQVFVCSELCADSARSPQVLIHRLLLPAAWLTGFCGIKLTNGLDSIHGNKNSLRSKIKKHNNRVNKKSHKSLEPINKMQQT